MAVSWCDGDAVADASVLSNGRSGTEDRIDDRCESRFSLPSALLPFAFWLDGPAEPLPVSLLLWDSMSCGAWNDIVEDARDGV